MPAQSTFCVEHMVWWTSAQYPYRPCVTGPLHPAKLTDPVAMCCTLSVTFTCVAHIAMYVFTFVSFCCLRLCYVTHLGIGSVFQHRGVSNERNFVHLVEKSVEIKLNLEIMRNQSRFPWNQARKSAQPSSSTHFYNIWRHFWGKSKRNQEISYVKIARCRPLGLFSCVCSDCMLCKQELWELFKGEVTWSQEQVQVTLICVGARVLCMWVTVYT